MLCTQNFWFHAPEHPLEIGLQAHLSFLLPFFSGSSGRVTALSPTPASLSFIVCGGHWLDQREWGWQNEILSALLLVTWCSNRESLWSNDFPNLGAGGSLPVGSQEVLDPHWPFLANQASRAEGWGATQALHYLQLPRPPWWCWGPKLIWLHNRHAPVISSGSNITNIDSLVLWGNVGFWISGVCREGRAGNWIQGLTHARQALCWTTSLAFVYVTS